MAKCPYGFDEEQYNALVLFGDALMNEHVLDRVQKQEIVKLLVNSIQGEHFNQEAIRSAINGEERHSAVYRAAYMLLEISFHTRKLAELNSDSPLLRANGDALEAASKVSPQAFLREFGLLSDLSALRKIFKELEKLDVIREHQVLTDLHQKQKICHHCVRSNEKKFAAEASTGTGLFKQNHETARSRFLKYFAFLTTRNINLDAPQETLGDSAKPKR